MENILITGICGGIGKACGYRLLKSGVKVIGVGHHTGELNEEWRDYHFLGIDADVTDIERLPELLEGITKTAGPVGGFVHCAGFDKMSPLSMTKPEDMEKLWRIHAQAPMVMISLLSKKKNHADGMSIVLISSQSAHEGAMGHTAYASAKGAVEGYLAAAAAELMEKNIRINEVCFSPVNTKMAKGWMDKLTPDSMQRLKRSYPLGIMEPADAASSILYLLSEESRYINGQIITVDSGHSVRKI